MAALRALLGLFEQDPAAERLRTQGGRAFVSTALRPYAIASLADASEQATLVVVGDDRAARDLAGDLRAWLSPLRSTC
jgi:transcription-repair coupling factor (superfamily II helicase)